MVTEIKQTTESAFALSGSLSVTTVTMLLAQGKRLFAAAKAPLQVSLQNVVDSDSAGIALLIEWTRLAREMHKEILFTQLPAKMYSIIQVGGLDTVLPINK